MTITWGDVGAIFAMLVVGSFIAGAIDTWLEQRKWEKQRKGTPPRKHNNTYLDLKG